jgi:hypothetical protein
VPVNGDAADLPGAVDRLDQLIRTREIEVCFAGICESCHLAFNETRRLISTCRRPLSW